MPVVNLALSLPDSFTEDDVRAALQAVTDTLERQPFDPLEGGIRISGDCIDEATGEIHLWDETL